MYPINALPSKDTTNKLAGLFFTLYPFNAERQPGWLGIVQLLSPFVWLRVLEQDPQLVPRYFRIVPAPDFLQIKTAFLLNEFARMFRLFQYYHCN